MTDEQALLASVLAAPEDDGPRLVYSDWLEEHGQAGRASLIRWQCERPLENWLVSAQNRWTYRGLDSSTIELDCPSYCETVWWQRGFIQAVRAHSGAWLRFGDDILRQHPVQTVRLTTLPEVESIDPELVPGQFSDRFVRSRLPGCKWRWNDDFPDRRIPVAIRPLAEALLRIEWPRVKTWEMPAHDDGQRLTGGIGSLIADSVADLLRGRLPQIEIVRR